MSRIRQVVCDHCGKAFDRPVNRANEAEKQGWLQFCSPDCQGNSRRVGEDQNCLTCGKPVYVTPSRKNPSKRVFCSKSCAATYNNQRRAPRSLESKERTRQAQIRHLQETNSGAIHAAKDCVICGNSFHPINKDARACSKICGQILHFGSLPLTKDEVISRIQQLYIEFGRTPTTKEVGHKLTGAASRFFGSWNKAMESLGIPPNTEWYTRKGIPCKDGHRADSISEKIVDDWLSAHGIQHTTQKRYPQSRCTCDFYLPDKDIWLEYFGLWHGHKDYDTAVGKKRDMAKRKGLTLREVFPSDLYPENHLDGVLGDLLPKSCGGPPLMFPPIPSYLWISCLCTTSSGDTENTTSPVLPMGSK